MIPEITLQTINDYVEHGFQPGGFVRAVLENKLSESFGRADSENREAMFEIVSYVYNNVPRGCWGNQEAVDDWLKYKREQKEANERRKRIDL